MSTITFKLVRKLDRICLDVLEQDKDTRGKGRLFTDPETKYIISSSDCPEIRDYGIFIGGYHSSRDHELYQSYATPEYGKEIISKILQTFTNWGKKLNQDLIYDPVSELYSLVDKNETSI